MLGPKGPLRCWGLAARWFVGAGTRVGGATAYAPPGATIGGECATAVRASVRAPGTCIRVPGQIRRRPQTPGVSPPRVSPWAMVRRPYRPLRRLSIRAHGPVWGAYAIRPYRGTCIRVFGQLPCPGRDRPQTPGVSPPRVSPWAMVRRPYRPLRRLSIRAHGPVWGAYAIRPYRGTCIRVFGQLPCPGRDRPQTPGLFYVLIGISVRLHLAFASGFLSVCEGKGLYVRRACQYVILRISSRPCAWPECSFCRRPICCLSAPYASHGVPEIREP